MFFLGWKQSLHLAFPKNVLGFSVTSLKVSSSLCVLNTTPIVVLGGLGVAKAVDIFPCRKVNRSLLYIFFLLFSFPSGFQIGSGACLQTNRSYHLPQKTLLLKRLVFSSVTLWHHSMSPFVEMYTSWISTAALLLLEVLGQTCLHRPIKAD